MENFLNNVFVVQGGRAQRRQRQADERLRPYIGRVEPGKICTADWNSFIARQWVPSKVVQIEQESCGRVEESGKTYNLDWYFLAGNDLQKWLKTHILYLNGHSYQMLVFCFQKSFVSCWVATVQLDLGAKLFKKRASYNPNVFVLTLVHGKTNMFCYW